MIRIVFRFRDIIVDRLVFFARPLALSGIGI